MFEPGCHERYVNFYTDFAFKKLFGTEVNKELLISFLNSLFDGEQVIKNLTYLNVEHFGHNAAERKAMFDVYCENQKDFWDMCAVTETAEKKGMAKGLAKGMAKGMAKGWQRELLLSGKTF